MSAVLLAIALAVPPPPKLGSSLVIDRPTQGTVVSVAGDVVVRSQVIGDVVAVAGNVVLEHSASVEGDVVSIGGRIVGEGRASGRAVSVASLGGPLSAGGPAQPLPVRVGLIAVRVGVWVTVGTLLLLVLPRAVRRGGQRLRDEPLRTTVVGLLVVIVWLAAVVLAVAASASAAGALVLVVGVGMFLAVKIFGVMAVAWVLGHLLTSALPLAWRGEIPRTATALVIMLLVGLLPAVGALLWVAISVAGLGAAASLLLARLPVLRAVPRLAI